MTQKSLAKVLDKNVFIRSAQKTIFFESLDFGGIMPQVLRNRHDHFRMFGDVNKPGYVNTFF